MAHRIEIPIMVHLAIKGDWAPLKRKDKRSAKKKKMSWQLVPDSGLKEMLGKRFIYMPANILF